MERKALKVQFKESGPEGSFEAVFAEFSKTDHDGDVTLPGAFKTGVMVPFAQTGHNWDVPTIGNGELKADNDRVWLDGLINLKMVAGREHYESMKFDVERGANAQQFSYAYDVEKGHSARPDEIKVYGPGTKRILESLIVHEVSPVLLGAGIGTGLQYFKGKGRNRKGIMSFEDIESSLQAAIDDWDKQESADEGEEWFYSDAYIVDTYPDHVVWEDMDDGFFSAPYMIMADGTMVLGDATPVSQTYTPKSLSDRAGFVAAVTRGLAKHAQAAASMRGRTRGKEGRVLSTANREKIVTNVEALRASLTELESLLAETDTSGKASEDLEIIRLRHNARMSRLSVAS